MRGRLWHVCCHHHHAEWLEGGALQKVVLVVTGVASKEVLERWTFDIQTDKGVVAGRWVRWHNARSEGCSTRPEGSSPDNRSLSKPSNSRWCSASLPEKAESQITQEIQAIIRQITASVTFLPLLQDACRFPCC